MSAAIYDPEQLKEQERADVENPDSKDNRPANDSSDPRGLSAQEATPADDNQVGRGYTGPGKPSGLRQHFTADKNRAAVVFGGAAAIIAIISVVIFLILLPAKIYSIVQNMQRIFFSSSENAVKKMEQQQLSTYVRKVITPGLGRGTCPRSTLAKIDRNCFVITDKGMFGNLFTAWKDASLEKRLADDGMEFYKQGPNMHLRITNTGDAIINDVVRPGSTINLVDSSGWQKLGTKNFKAAVSNRIDEHMQHASYYKKTMYRYKVARLLEHKYGIKLCIIACDSRRDFKDYKDKKIAAAIIRAQRVLQPRDQMLGFILDCLLGYSPSGRGGSCDYTRTADESEQPNINEDGCQKNCNLNGLPRSPEEKEAQRIFDELALKYGITSAEDLAKAKLLLDAYQGGGFKRYLLTQTIYKALIGMGSNDGKIGQDAGKLAGQIADDYLVAIKAVSIAATLVGAADALAKYMPALSYATQAQTMVSTFATYRTYTDECKTGNCDPAMFGSFISSLGQGNQDPTGKQSNDIGGIAEAEHTPLYSALLGDKSGLGASDNLCDKPTNTNITPSVPAGQIVCPEERIDSKPRIDIGGITKVGGWSELATAATAFNTVKYAFNNVFTALICKLGICDWLSSAVKGALGALTNALQPFVGKLIKRISNFLMDYLLPPPPTGTWPSGGRTFDMIAAGADVSGNDFAQHSLGGVVLSARQVAEIRTEQQTAEQYRYNSQSFFAKMFDKDYQYSAISKVAMAIPAKPTDAARTALASFISNPFNKIFHSFATIFNLRPKFALAEAATKNCSTELLTTDPFCVTQYGYPQDDTIFQQDPQAYWDKNCVAPGTATGVINPKITGWNQSAADFANGSAGGTIHLGQNIQGGYTALDPTGTNPCLLIMAAAGAGGGAFSTSVLNPDDLADVSSSSGGSGGPIDCSSTAGPDQSPGTLRPEDQKYAPLIAAQAPGRSCPGTPTPPGAIPNDPTKEYFGQCGDSNVCNIYTDSKGQYISVKYRNPPGRGDTRQVYINGSGSAPQPSAGVCTQFPSGQYRWIGGPKAGQLCP